MLIYFCSFPPSILLPTKAITLLNWSMIGIISLPPSQSKTLPFFSPQVPDATRAASMRSRLSESIISAVKKNDVQLFVSTHNIDMLKSLVDVVSCEDENLIASYKLVRKSDDEIVALNYEIESLSYSVLNDIEVR